MDPSVNEKAFQENQEFRENIEQEEAASIQPEFHESGRQKALREKVEHPKGFAARDPEEQMHHEARRLHLHRPPRSGHGSSLARFRERRGEGEEEPERILD